MKSDRETEFHNFVLQNFLKNINNQHYSRFTDKWRSIAERVIGTIRQLLKKPVFEKGNASWITEITSAIKQYNNTIHHSIKVTPVQVSKIGTDKVVFDNVQDRTVRQKPKYKLGQLARTFNIKKVFSKGDSTNWSTKIYCIQ